ncbi:uncharacterized protein LOC134857043 [Symsagittifera roscoffensis]|uniref:uncharacterized protein LOC134857043 n=1 Tax=Symsagittifera roscoffensis TaxID=84072 RepID=UPI00307C0078
MDNELTIYRGDLESHPKTVQYEENNTSLKRKIARAFREEIPPESLYEVTEPSDNTVSVVPVSLLSPGRTYLWPYTEKWHDKLLLQNALFSSNAAYQNEPLKYLQGQENRQFHEITKIIAVNIRLGKQVASLFLASRGLKNTLIVAFRGTSSKEDVQSDIEIGFSTDNRLQGQIHGGFLSRAQEVAESLGVILNIAKDNNARQILTCGHSLGGAVSSLVHMFLLFELHNSEQNDINISKENVINITFGAPMVGDRVFANSVRERGFTENIFQFASAWDVVPVILSFGHFKEFLRNAPARTCKEKVLKALGVIGSLFFKIRPTETTKLCLVVLGLETEADKIKNALVVLKSCKTTLQRSFDESHYVPIGNYLRIREKEITPVGNNEKIIELLLKEALQSEDVSISELQQGHLLKSYFNCIKNIKEFVTCDKNDKILLDKTTVMNFVADDGLSYTFDKACSFTCGYVYCSKPLFLNNKTVKLCLGCKDDPQMSEHVFHTTCWEHLHKENDPNRGNHECTTINSDDLGNIDGQENFFYDESKFIKSLKLYFSTFIVAGNQIYWGPTFHRKLVRAVGDFDNSLNDRNVLGLYEEKTCTDQHVLINKTENQPNNAFQNGLKLESLTIKVTNFISKVKRQEIITEKSIALSTLFCYNSICDLTSFYKGKINKTAYAKYLTENFAASLSSAFFSWGAECISTQIPFQVAYPHHTPWFSYTVSAFGIPCGFLGGVMGYVWLKKISARAGWIKTEEDKMKADIIADALNFLDVPLSNNDFRKLTKSDVTKCAKKKSLFYYSAASSPGATEEERNQNEVLRQMVQLSQKILIKFCQDSQVLSNCVIKLVQPKSMLREDFQVHKMKEKLDKLNKYWEKIGSNRVIQLAATQN